MNDRELLELAAKAVHGEFANQMIESGWNPLTDDGDALRLAVKLNMLVDCHGQCARPLPDGMAWQEASGPDVYANMRRAIVKAAAEIGRAMP